MAKEVEILKKPYKLEKWSQAQIVEMAKCINDPIYFIQKYMMVQHPLKGAVPLELYPYQKVMVESFKKYRNVVALTGRQLGKCVFGNTFITKDGKKVKIKELVNLNLKDRIVDKLEEYLVKLST